LLRKENGALIPVFAIFPSEGFFAVSRDEKDRGKGESMKEESKTVVVKGKQFRLSTVDGQASLQLVVKKEKKDRKV